MSKSISKINGFPIEGGIKEVTIPNMGVVQFGCINNLEGLGLLSDGAQQQDSIRDGFLVVRPLTNKLELGYRVSSGSVMQYYVQEPAISGELYLVYFDGSEVTKEHIIRPYKTLKYVGNISDYLFPDTWYSLARATANVSITIPGVYYFHAFGITSHIITINNRYCITAGINTDLVIAAVKDNTNNITCKVLSGINYNLNYQGNVISMNVNGNYVLYPGDDLNASLSIGVNPDSSLDKSVKLISLVDGINLKLSAMNTEFSLLKTNSLTLSKGLNNLIVESDGTVTIS